MSKVDKIRKLLLKKEEHFNLNSTLNSDDDNNLIKKLKIKKSALLKANFYSTIAPILFNKSVEAMGYLIAPEGTSEDAVNDIYLSHNQSVTSSKCTGDPFSEMNEFKKIQMKGSKIIGWWHSHGLDHEPFHSLDDRENFKGVSYSVFPNNKVTIENFVDISNLDDRYCLNYSKKDGKDYLLINQNNNNSHSFRLSIDKINSEILPLLKDVKITKVEKADPIKISYAYSMVTNSKNMQPYLEVSYKGKGDEKINYIKGKDVSLEVIDNEKIQFEDYKKLVDDVSKRVHHNGKLPTRKVSDYELRTIINQVETRVNNFNMTMIKPSEKDEEVNKNLEEIITKTPEEKLKDKGEEQKNVYKKETPIDHVKQLPAITYNKLNNSAEEKKIVKPKINEVVHRIGDSNLEGIIDKYNNHKELTKKQICNEYNINSYTLDRILREAENKGYNIERRANKISDENKADIINLYNNTNVKVKDLRSELNKNRQENEPEKKFSTSTLYRILHKYENNGNNVNWRRKNNKKEPPNIIRYNPIAYISNTLKEYSAKTKSFMKRTVKKYWKIGLIGALSLAIGAGSLMYANHKRINSIKDIQPTKKIEQIIEKENNIPLVVYNPSNKVNYAGEDITQHIDKTAINNQANKMEYVIQKGDTLWEIMDKKTGNPGLWELVYAANESSASNQNQKNRQQKIREFGKKYNIESLKNAGNNGSLKPYELKDQYKIKDKTKIELSKTLSDDISKLNPQLQKEFNKIFYKASG